MCGGKERSLMQTVYVFPSQHSSQTAVFIQNRRSRRETQEKGQRPTDDIILSYLFRLPPSLEGGGAPAFGRCSRLNVPVVGTCGVFVSSFASQPHHQSILMHSAEHHFPCPSSLGKARFSGLMFTPSNLFNKPPSQKRSLTGGRSLK